MNEGRFSLARLCRSPRWLLLCMVSFQVVSAEAQTVDTFNPSPNGLIACLALQSDGRVLIGGDFSLLSGQYYPQFARLNPNGTVDSLLKLPAGDDVTAVVCLPDGRMLVGGRFMSFGGMPRGRIARVNENGTLDLGFNPNADGTVFALLPLDDGKILVGGAFSYIGGKPQPNLARLFADGTLDTSFTNTPNNIVYALTVQTNGQILVGGSFTALGGLPRNRLARLNADGSVDPGFNPGAGNYVQCLAVQPDGRILVAGTFSTLAGATVYQIGRLTSEGSLDASFSAGTIANGTVNSIALQTDGRMLIGGLFSRFSGQTRYNLCRLNSDGSLDTTFTANLSSGPSYSARAVAIQADGKILVGGLFTTVAGVSRPNLARLSNNVPSTATLELAASTVTWLRGGSSPEVWRTTFEASTDGTNWFYLGNGEPMAGGWQLAGATVPEGADIRARGFVRGGQFTGSGWFVESRMHPIILVPPAGHITNAYASATFTVSAGGNPPLAYQWYKDGVPLSNGGKVSGADTPALSLSAVLGGDRGAYQVVVTNVFGAVTSSVASLSVIDPRITSQPVNRTNNPFTTATFGVTASGSYPISYQWRKEADWLANGPTISGAQTSTLTLSNVLGSEAAKYSVVLSNLYGSVTSSVAKLTVVDPLMAAQPVNLVVSPGSAATFTAAAIGSEPFAFQWRKEGVPLAGQTAGSLVITNTTWADDGSYDVVITNAFGSVISATATLSVSLAVADPWPPESVDYVTRTVALQPDGKTLFAADWVRFRRLQPDGFRDQDFAPGTDGSIYTIVVQPDLKILVGGWFTSFTGGLRRAIARVNPDGSLDSFNPGSNSEVNCFVIQPDGKVIAGGSFSQLGGDSRDYLGRLHQNGVLDWSFTPDLDGRVYSLAMQEDGRMLVGGAFTSIGGQTRKFLARFNTNGTLDTSFVASVAIDSPVFGVAVQADGKILVVRNFTLQYGSFHYNLWRLNPDGSADGAFQAANNDFVNSMAIQADGKIVLGGNFTTLGGKPRKYLGRLHPDGTLDTTFNPTAGGVVHTVALQTDGKVIVGGEFGAMGGRGQGPLARLTATDPATQSLQVSGSTITWMRGGTSPEVWSTQFEGSTNGTEWTNLGRGTRIPGGWTLTTASIPERGTLRARGFLNGGRYNGSSWFVETTLAITPRPHILVNDSEFGFHANAFGVPIVAPTGHTAVVETSTDLVHWTPVTTNAMGTTNLFLYRDKDATSRPGRFYRARLDFPEP